METRHHVEIYFAVSFSDLLSLRSSGGLNLNIFAKYLCFFNKKTTAYKSIQNSVRKVYIAKPIEVVIVCKIREISKSSALFR